MAQLPSLGDMHDLMAKAFRRQVGDRFVLAAQGPKHFKAFSKAVVDWATITTTTTTTTTTADGPGLAAAVSNIFDEGICGLPLDEEKEQLRELTAVARIVNQALHFWNGDAKLALFGEESDVARLSSAGIIFEAAQSLAALQMKIASLNDVSQKAAEFIKIITDIFEKDVHNAGRALTVLFGIKGSLDDIVSRLVSSCMAKLEQCIGSVAKSMNNRVQHLIQQGQKHMAAEEVTAIDKLVQTYPGQEGSGAAIVNMLQKASADTSVGECRTVLTDLRELYEFENETGALSTRILTLRGAWPLVNICIPSVDQQILATSFEDKTITNLAVKLGDWTAIQACEKTLPKSQDAAAFCKKVMTGLSKKKWHGLSISVQLRLTVCAQAAVPASAAQ